LRLALLLLWAGPALAFAAPSLPGALEQRRQGNFEEAILELQALIKAEPGDSLAWYELGLTYASDGQYPKAADAYRLALAGGHPGPQCHCALALALRESGKPAVSLTEALKCRELLPRYAGAWNLVGNAETDLEHPSEALAAYQKAVELSPAYANAQFNEGVALFALGRASEAEAAYLKAVKLSPLQPEIWTGLGDAQLRLKKAGQAQKSYRKALKVSPGYAAAEWGLSRAFQAQGNAKEARRHERAYKRLIRDADNRRFLKADEKKRRAAALEMEAWDKELRESR
jgi:tetratricopeptide (TPR) repeat protein